jgi:hypothetical protein
MDNKIKNQGLGVFLMSNPSKWLIYAQHECLYLAGPCYGGDHIVAAMNLSICPRCGEPCDLFNRDTWARVIRRKVSDSVWWRPSTWGRFHWEYRSRGHLEAGGYNYRKFMINAKKPEENCELGSITESFHAGASSPR